MLVILGLEVLAAMLFLSVVAGISLLTGIVFVIIRAMSRWAAADRRRFDAYLRRQYEEGKITRELAIWRAHDRGTQEAILYEKPPPSLIEQDQAAITH